MPVFGNSTEHPRRVEAFFSRIRDLSWTGEDRLASLDAIHEALNDLAQYEIEYYYYYYFARKRQRQVSSVMRGGTLVLGTAGLLAPLIAAADHERYAFLSPWGYVWLGGAAAILAVNKIFGANRRPHPPGAGAVRPRVPGHRVSHRVATLAGAARPIAGGPVAGRRGLRQLPALRRRDVQADRQRDQILGTRRHRGSRGIRALPERTNRRPAAQALGQRAALSRSTRPTP